MVVIELVNKFAYYVLLNIVSFRLDVYKVRAQARLINESQLRFELVLPWLVRAFKRSNPELFTSGMAHFHP